MNKTPEKILERNRANYYKNKQAYIDRAKKWKKNNPEKVRESNRKTRAKYPKASAEWQDKRTRDVIKQLGGKCKECGINKIPVLQIHHKPGQKKKPRDWMSVKYNLGKLILLCANCHCLIHYKNKYGT